jgi:hypothetical protein
MFKSDMVENLYKISVTYAILLTVYQYRFFSRPSRVKDKNRCSFRTWQICGSVTTNRVCGCVCGWGCVCWVCGCGCVWVWVCVCVCVWVWVCVGGCWCVCVGGGVNAQLKQMRLLQIQKTACTDRSSISNFVSKRSITTLQCQSNKHYLNKCYLKTVHISITPISYFWHRKNTHTELVISYFKNLKAIKKDMKASNTAYLLYHPAFRYAGKQW